MVYDVVSAKFYIADIKLTVCLNAVGDCDYTETVSSMIILPKPPVEELNNGNKYFVLFESQNHILRCMSTPLCFSVFF